MHPNLVIKRRRPNLIALHGSERGLTKLVGLHPTQ